MMPAEARVAAGRVAVTRRTAVPGSAAIELVERGDHAPDFFAVQAVIHHLRVLADGNKVLVAEARQVLRQRGLTQGHFFIELSDGFLTLQKMTEDEQSAFVPQSFQQCRRYPGIFSHLL